MDLYKNNIHDFIQLNIFWYKYKHIAIYSFITALSVDKNVKQSIITLQKHYFEHYLDKIVDKPLLSGSEIMRILNIPPSKKVGEIKEKLVLAQLSGKIKTKEDAIHYIKTLE